MLMQRLAQVSLLIAVLLFAHCGIDQLTGLMAANLQAITGGLQ